MWIGIAVLTYILGVIFLLWFFQLVHRWDQEEIQSMKNQSNHTERKKEIQYRPVV